MSIASLVLVLLLCYHALPAYSQTREISNFFYEDISLEIGADNDSLVHTRPKQLSTPVCSRYGYKDRDSPAKIFLGVNFRFATKPVVNFAFHSF